MSAKHGLAGFTKTVALELAEHGVTANAISPGFVWTPLVEKQIPDLAKSENITLEQAKQQVLSRQPTNQFVTVEQVAALAAFLASEAAASITGANYSHRWRLDRAVASPARNPGSEDCRDLAIAAGGLRAVSIRDGVMRGAPSAAQQRGGDECDRGNVSSAASTISAPTAAPGAG